MAPTVASIGRWADHRFTKGEQAAFGRWTFLSAGARRSLLPQKAGNAKSSVVNSLSASASAPSLSLTPSTPPDLGYNTSCVQGLLNRLLPASRGVTEVDADSSLKCAWDVESVASSTDTPAESTWPRSTCNSSWPHPSVSSDFLTISQKFQHPILDDFRHKLLQRYLSLHDAFSRLDHGAARYRGLNMKEFRVAIERLDVGDVDCEELFVVLDTKNDGTISLSEFLHALVHTSTDILLWELRCCLLRAAIRPEKLQKALRLVEFPQHGWQSKATEIKRRVSSDAHARKCRACTAGLHHGCSCAEKSSNQGSEGTDPAESPELSLWTDSTSSNQAKQSSYHFTRGDWLKLCTSIYMTLLEAERLYTHLADESGMVDLRATFETLRTTVEPDISLARFSTKVLRRYGSPQNAFMAFCEDGSGSPTHKDPVLRWEGFHSLAVKLNVNDANAGKIWDVLGTSGIEGHDAHAGVGSVNSAGVKEDIFVHQLSLWLPDTALQALDNELCDCFGNLAEGQRALGKRLSSTDPLSPREFASQLSAFGIKDCDVGKALGTVASTHGKPGNPVSLDMVISSMRASRRSSAHAARPAKCARAAIKQDNLLVWNQLRTVQRDLMQRHDDELSKTPAGIQLVVSPAVPPRSPRQLSEKHNFSAAVHGAVRTAETSRSKHVLQCAKRQVLRLEERWASSPPLGVSTSKSFESRTTSKSFDSRSSSKSFESRSSSKSFESRSSSKSFESQSSSKALGAPRTFRFGGG